METDMSSKAGANGKHSGVLENNTDDVEDKEDLLSDKPSKCTAHDDLFKFYCEKDDKLCCTMCAVYDHSEPSCKESVTLISTIANTDKANKYFSEVREKVNTVLSRLAALKTDKKDYTSALSSSKTDCKKCIEETANDMIGHIRQMQNSALVQLDSVFESRMKDIKKDLDKHSKAETDIITFQKQVEDVLESNTKETFIKMKLYKETLAMYENTFKSVTDDEKQILRFTADKEFLGVVRCTQSLGQSALAELWKDAVEVKVGNIIDVEADVVVNSARWQLTEGGGELSRTFNKKAGMGMQEELTKKYPTGLQLWQVVESDPHDLTNCKMVLHCLPKEYKGTDDLHMLKKLVNKCLTKATDSGYNSIAIPALGTGVLQYPKEAVAEAMFEEVVSFLKESTRRSSLQKVLFVAYDKDKEVIEAFEKASKKYL